MLVLVLFIHITQVPTAHSEVPPPYYEVIGHVASMVDGDTTRVIIDTILVDLDPAGNVHVGVNESVRYGGGVDAPEMSTPWGPPCRDFIQSLIPVGITVYLDLDNYASGQSIYRDPYGRLVGVIYAVIDGQWVNVNAELLKWGMEEYPDHDWDKYRYIYSEFDCHDWPPYDNNYPYVRGFDTTRSSIDSITPYWRASVPFTITAATIVDLDSVSLYYRYSADNSGWGENTFFGSDDSSPYSWSFTAPHGDGYYEFYSIGREGDNVESSPAVADAGCGVDMIAPASSVDTISPYLQTSTSLQITATASDATSGVKEISLYYRYSTDNLSWSVWTLYGTDTVAPWAWSVVAPSGNGYYEFYSIARDKATNAESAPTAADTRCRIGTDGPSAPAKSSPAAGTTIYDNTPTFTWSTVTGSSVGIARYELWVDDNSDFSSPKILENTADNVTTSYTPTTELANGNYSWRVRAWDQAGKSSPFEQAWTFTINTALTPAQRGVEVSIFPSSKSGALGESLIYTVTVTNTGDVTEDYDLSKIDTLGWSLTLQLSVAGIEPNEERQVTLTVVISPTAENNASDSITVTATSSEDNTIKDSASCTALCVASAKGVTFLTISPSRFALYPGYSGQVKELTATLRDSNYNLLANKAITWSATAGSVSPSSGTTNALGQVSVVYTSPTVTAETPQVTITASFAGDAQYQASSGTSLGIIATPTTVNISSDGGTVIINVIEIDVTMTILEVPQNALSENTAITVVQKPIAAPAGYAGLSNIFDIGPSGATFAIPSTLTLPYDESELPIGVSEGDLAIYHRTSGGGWERVGGSVNTTANTVSVQIDHLSEYAVMASIPPPPPSEGGLPLLTIGVIIAVILIITIITILIRRR